MLHLSASITVKACRQDVFKLLSNLHRYPSYFNYLKKLTIVSQSLNSCIADIDEEIEGITEAIRAKFEFYPPERIEVEQLVGPFKSMQARFILTDLTETEGGLRPQNGESTLILHEVYIEVGIGIIGRAVEEFLVRSKLQKKMELELEAIKNALESDKSDKSEA
jgi:ribosome-associated toxin RatA of RatAB toxin-antitoxin module